MQLQTLGIGMPNRPSNLPSQLGNRQQLVQSDGAIVTTNDEFPNNSGLSAPPGLPQLTTGGAQQNLGPSSSGVGLVPPSNQHSYGVGSSQQQHQQPFGGGHSLPRPSFLNQAIHLHRARAQEVVQKMERN